MKHTLITLLLMAAITGLCRAQASTVSKADFQALVTTLKGNIEQNKAADAGKTWIELHNMMLTEFATVKTKIKDAVDRNDDVGKNKYINIHNSQISIYSNIVKHKDNLVPYSAELFDELDRYIKAML